MYYKLYYDNNKAKRGFFFVLYNSLKKRKIN